MEWGSIIVGLMGIIGTLLKWWIDDAPKRQKEAADEKTQRGRSDIADGNDDAVNDRLDELLPNDGQNSIAGQYDTSDLLRRTQAVTGADILPDRTGSPGPPAGDSGAM